MAESANQVEDKDLVKVFDGTTPLGTFSGSDIPGPFVCTNGYVFITWSSNSTTQLPGWEISYEIDNVGVDEAEVFSNVEVFPNPASEALNVSFMNEKGQSVNIRLVDVTGEIIYSNTLNGTGVEISENIDVTNFAKGIYILNLTSDQGSVNRKVVIR